MNNPPDKILTDAKGAAAMFNMSRSFFYGQFSSGRIAPLPISFGKKKLWRVADLQAWVAGGCKNRDEFYSTQERSDER